MRQSDYRNPPKADIKAKKLLNFNTERIDNYFWLNDKNNKEVIDYLKEENKYTEEIMADTKKLQEDIYSEILGRIKEDDESYPYLDNGYYYFSRTEKNKQYGVILRKKGSLEEREEVVFDINKLAENEKAFIFGGYEVSTDNKLTAYTYNTTGSYAEYTLKIKSLETGKNLDFEIEGVASFTFANDNRTLFYTKINSTLKSDSVYRIDIYTKDETLIYKEVGEEFSCYVSKDKQDKYIYISSFSSTTDEERFISADSPTDEFIIFQKRKHKTEYSIEPHVNSFIVKYKDEEHINGMLYKAPIETHSDKSTWELIIPHNNEVFLEGAVVLKDHIVTTTRYKGLKSINVLHINDGYRSEKIEFPESVYHVGISGGKQFDTVVFRYSYSSLKRPATLYEYNISTKESKTLKVQEIPSGFNTDDYKVERIMVTANDGAEVPMAVIYKTPFTFDGERPALLYGYGSYGSNTNPSFNSVIFSLVDRGYVFAMAQIRGGSEMGEKWYEEGKLLKKKNTFTDFISCAEHLIDKNFTSNKKLSIMGGSAGGLLTTAVTNMRPDLFHSVLSLVPFVDVVTSMLDDTLPLTTGEYEEWGNPNEKEYFDYMLSYSPYDNIKAQDYPHMLVTGGLNDSQVLFHEPSKYTAKIRALKTDDNVVLLKMNMDSGHGGSTGRYNRIKDLAFHYAFLLKTLED